MPQKTDNQKGSTNIILIFLVALLLVSNLLTIYYFYLKNKDKPQPQNIIVQQTEEPIENASDSNLNISTDIEETQEQEEVQEQEEIETETSEEETETEEETQETEIEEIDLKEGEILVQWNSEPIFADYDSVFDYDYIYQKIQDYNEANKTANIDKNILTDFKIHEAGKIKQGSYAGKEMYIRPVPKLIF